MWPRRGCGVSPGRVSAVREFNRVYTNLIGLLRGGYLDSPYSLTEARVLFELARRSACEISSLRGSLDIDAGYLSRIMARLESDGLITREKFRGRCPPPGHRADRPRRQRRRRAGPALGRGYRRAARPG